MAERVPSNFRRQEEPFIGTISTQDIATGKAYATFYGAKTEGNEYFLTSIQRHPNDGDQTTEGTIPDTTEGDYLEVNFDLDFNTYRVIEGELFVTATIETTVSGGGTSATNFAKITIYRVDADSNESTIGTQITTDSESVGADSSDSFGIFGSFTIAKTEFFEGEKLRVEVILRGAETGSGSATGRIWHDPTNTFTTLGSNSPENPSTFIVDIPFRIDI